MEIKVGSYVKVKDGTECPDIESESMDNWAGRVLEIDDGLAHIHLDDLCPLFYSVEYMCHIEENGLDHETTRLDISELELSAKRKVSYEDRKLGLLRLDCAFTYSKSADKISKYIEVLQTADLSDTFGIQKRWHSYLCDNFTPPVDVDIVDLPVGKDTGSLISINDYFIDHQGISGVVKLKHSGKTRHFHLIDLDVPDPISKNSRSI